MESDAMRLRGRITSLGADDAVAVAETRPASLSALFNQHYAGLVRIACLLVDSDDLAEDCVQEAFARVHRRWERIDDPVAYLRTAVLNAARDHLRRQRVRRAFRPDPVAEESIPELDDQLDASLRRLSERRRIAIVLRYYADLPDDEIADHLGCRNATVRSLIHRGLTDLRKEVAS